MRLSLAAIVACSFLGCASSTYAPDELNAALDADGGTGGGALSNALSLAQMGANDFQNSETIGTQIAADAQKQQPQRWNLVVSEVGGVKQAASALLEQALQLQQSGRHDAGADDPLIVIATGVMARADQFFAPSPNGLGGDVVGTSGTVASSPATIKAQVNELEKLLDRTVRELDRAEDIVERVNRRQN